MGLLWVANPIDVAMCWGGFLHLALESREEIVISGVPVAHIVAQCALTCQMMSVSEQFSHVIQAAVERGRLHP